MISGVAIFLSIWLICPIFSASVILFIKSLILTFKGCLGSLYLKYSASVNAANKHSSNATHATDFGTENILILDTAHPYGLEICNNVHVKITIKHFLKLQNVTNYKNMLEVKTIA